MPSGRENALVSPIPGLAFGELGRVQARGTAPTAKTKGQSGLAEGSFEDRRAHPDPYRGDRAERGAEGLDGGPRANSALWTRQQTGASVERVQEAGTRHPLATTGNQAASGRETFRDGVPQTADSTRPANVMF